VTGQGWGLAYDASARELVASDGSDHLFFWAAAFPFAEKRFLRVTLPVVAATAAAPTAAASDTDTVASGGGPVSAAGVPVSFAPLWYINELEVVDEGRFGLANVW